MFGEKLASRAMKVGMVTMLFVALMFSGMSAMFSTNLDAEAQILGGEYGGDLRVALKGEPNTFNPLSDSANEPAMQVIDIMYDSLGRINPYTYALEPWIAAGWEIDPDDDSIVTVTLRSDVKWHDGSMVTIEDVEYTFGPSGYNIAYIDTMTLNTLNNSITFDLDAPDSRFFSEVIGLKLVQDGYSKTSTEEMGCGPFYLDASDSDRVLAFDDYFKGRVYLDSITYTYYDENLDAIYDIITSKIDFIAWDLTSNDTTLMVEVPIGTGDYTNLVQDANVSVERSSGMDYWYLGMNCDEDHVLYEPALRKAIAHVIDKAALTVFDIGGGLEVSDSIVSKYNVPWYNSTITTYPFDTTEASKILNDADYFDYNGDGWRDMPNGTSFSFKLLGPHEQDLTPNVMAGIVAEWLQDIGINTELVADTDENHLVNIEANDFDMFLFTEERASIDPQYIETMYSLDGIATSDNLLNFKPVIDIVDESIADKIDNTTYSCYLNNTNVIGDVVLESNGTIIPTGYTVDDETGMITIEAATFDALKLEQGLNVSYSYLPFDHLMSLANAQMDPAMRSKYIMETQALIADFMPSIPLFSFRVNHAYNSSGFIGWTKTLGGVNNFWSFINLRNHMNEGGMGVSISLPLAVSDDGMLGGEEINLQIKVEDIDGNPLNMADIVLSGEGTFGTPAYDVGTGSYTVSYMAPDIESTRTITIVASASKVSYGGGQGEIDVTIRSLTNDFTIEVSKEESSIPSNNATTISYLVLDRTTKAAVADADVTLTITPTGLGGYLSEYSGVTDSSGEFIVTFGADNVTIDTTFSISIEVTKDSYNAATKSTSINVVKMDTEAPDDGLLGLPAPSLILVLIAFAGLALIVRGRKQ